MKHFKYIKTETSLTNDEVCYGKVISRERPVREHSTVEVDWLINNRNFGRTVCTCVCKEITEEEYIAAMVIES